MILKKIMLKDFRPYYGVQTIEFVSGEKNITLIKAENGTGKTTLLEAFKWCLYGEKLTLPNPNNFMNERAIVEMSNGTERDVTIKLYFEENKTNYEITRTIVFKKTIKGLNKISASVSLKSSSGISSNVEKIVNEKIQELVPKEINFFFDGERLKKLENKIEIKDSIIKILKIKALDNGKKDVESIRKIVEQNLIKNDSDNRRYLDLTQNRSKKNAEKYQIKEGIEQIEKQIKSYMESKDKNSEEQEKIIRKIEESTELENSVNKLELKNIKLKNSIEIDSKKYYEKLSKKSYLLFSTEILKESKKILDESTEKGYLPTNVKDTLIEEILKKRVCICGNNIEENSFFEKELKKLLDTKSTSSEEEELFFDIKSKVKKGLNEIKNPLQFYEELENMKSKIINDKYELEKNSYELEDLKKGYDKTEIDNLKEIQKINREIDKNIEKNNNLLNSEREKLGGINGEAQSIENKIRILEKDKNIDQNDRKTLDIIDKVRKALGDLYQMKLTKERISLEKKLQKIYDQVTRKGYIPEINENFEMKIKKHYQLEDEVALSEGENKVLTLCFIGALVDLARDLEKSEVTTDIGGIYPIVLDSPYGDLDVDHKLQMTKVIHSLSDQIIIFASSSQWSQEVNDEINHKVGKVYKLRNRNPKNTQNNINYEYTEILQ